MLILKKPNRKKFIAWLLSLFFCISSSFSILCLSCIANTSELNFKVYNPDASNSNNTTNSSITTNTPAINDKDVRASDKDTNAFLSTETPQSDSNLKETTGSNPIPAPAATPATNANAGTNQSSEPDTTITSSNKNNDQGSTTIETKTTGEQAAELSGEASDSTTPGDNTNQSGNNKILQGYVRIVPTGTKIPIVMDTAVDSDTSQEGDEFSARTVEDLTIDGTTVIPAGSIIRGRIATIGAPKHLNRSGSVALKFDTVTTPDNRQIPLVANLVARGGVVHARRGMKDIAIDTATFSLPTLVALGIGAVAGHSSSSVGVGGGALIGAGVGAAVGLAILLAKKGKKVDVRPGDELKIELAEDLHMPTI